MIKKEWISPKGNKKTTRVGRVDAIKAGREEGNRRNGGETVGDTPIWLPDWSGAAREDYEYRAARVYIGVESGPTTGYRLAVFGRKSGSSDFHQRRITRLSRKSSIL